MHSDLAQQRLSRASGAEPAHLAPGRYLLRTTKLAEAQPGPTLLVGHSYGGAADYRAGRFSNAIGLVYVAAFAPDAGESLGSIGALRALPAGAASVQPDKYGFVDRSDKFHESFCQDLDEEQALVMALTQKPTLPLFRGSIRTAGGLGRTSPAGIRSLRTRHTG